MDYEEENKKLLKLYQDTGNSLYIEQLYKINKGLFYKICKRVNYLEELPDLLQECYIALDRAIKTFEDEKGSFSGYLAKVTSYHLLRYARKNSNIFIPEYMQQLIYKYLSLNVEENKRTDEEICFLLEITPEVLEEIKKALYIKNVGRLDEPLQDNEELCKYDLIADQEEPLEEKILNNIFNDELAAVLYKALEELPEQQKDLIELRFYKNMTYREIDPFRSEQNTKQKIDKICRKLRKNENLRIFYQETNCYTCTGFGYWKQTQQSAIERTVIYKYGLEN